MSDAEDAAAVLAQMVPIGDDHPLVQEFRGAVLEDLASRPAPKPPLRVVSPEHPTALQARLDRISEQLDEVLGLLRENR